MLGNWFSDDFLGCSRLLPKMKPISNIVYEKQYLKIFSCLDLKKHINTQIKKTYRMSAGEVGFGDLSIDVSLEVRNNSIVNYCI